MYELIAEDETTEENLDPYNRRYLQVLINELTAVHGYVANGADMSTLNNVTMVSIDALNFTQAPTKRLFLALKPQPGIDYGFKAEVLLRYYEYDPNCAVNMAWNGTDCVVDHEAYCASLTDKYRQQLNSDTLVVSYNGQSCVYTYEEVVDVESIEYVYTISGTSNRDIDTIVNIVPYTGPLKDVIIDRETLRTEHKAEKE